jgi:hypothetical protein
MASILNETNVAPVLGVQTAAMFVCIVEESNLK